MKLKLRSTNSSIRIRARLATNEDFNKISDYVKNKGMVRICINDISIESSNFRNLLGP